MSTPKQYNTNMLTPGNFAYIDGEVAFSHIAKAYDGEELTRENERRAKWGITPTDKPYTRISIKNARIRPINQSQYSTEESYVMERMYTTKKEPNVTCYEGISKGIILPTVVDAQGNQVHLQGKELAKGLKVTLVMQCFKASPQNGFGLQAVVVNEDIRYYENNGQVGEALKQLGITYTATPEPAQEPTVDTQSTTPAVVPAVTPPVEQAQPVIANPTPQPTPTPATPQVPQAPIPPAPPMPQPTTPNGVRTDV